MGILRDPVDALVQDLDGVHDHEHRQQVFLRHAANFGVTRFAYLNTCHADAPFHVETNYPAEWAEHYRASGYVHVDPVAQEGLRSPLPFLWRAALALPRYGAEAQKVFDEAAEFGLRDGLTVPIHAAGGIGMMSMAVDDAALFGPGAAAERHALHLMALHFHMACDRALAAGPVRPVPYLTPREREVLLWAARGKTAWEIGQILKLTARTVTYHVENARSKLGASSRAQAVVTAMMLGLIRP